MPPRPHELTITKTEFETWLVKTLKTQKPPSLRKVASYGALSKSTLAYQIKNDSIDPHTVFAIARGIGKNPLHELSTFHNFSFLATAKENPASDTEILFALAVPDVLREILRRYEVSTAPLSLTETSPEQSWQRWFKACAPQVASKDIQGVLGISTTSISRNQQTGRWNMQQIFILTQNFHLHTAIALVVSGFLSWREAGYPEKVIQQRVENFPLELLVTFLSSTTSKIPQDLKLHRENRLRNISIEYLA